VAGAAGGAARQRVQPQAGSVRHHPGEAHGAAPRAPQALLRPLQQRHQRKRAARYLISVAALQVGNGMDVRAHLVLCS
jgi:hypothetical protein